MIDPSVSPTRRAFLGRAAALSALPLLGGVHLVGAEETPAAKLITRLKDPLNLEFPFASLDAFLTPTELFYVRNHYAVPKLDAKTFRLEVKGAVKKPLKLSLDDLRKLKEVTQSLTLECAGNGRSFLRPKSKGVQWELGAVSTAQWTGVPLSSVLEMAGVEKEAVEVILVGADKGDPKKDKDIQPAHDVAFSRSMSLSKANKSEVMLVWKMNGKELTPNHGYPLRCVVGGWFGMASVKWLTQIVVTKTPYRGFDQTIDYAVWTVDENGLDQLTPLTEAGVKASIARPFVGETVAAGKVYRVHGAAWAGESEVAKVEVSVDGGKSWSDAKLTGKHVPFCWRMWEHSWKPQAGSAVLMARATDKRCRVQPMKHDPNRRNYAISFVQPTAVTVK
jgi:DMSO/TMAO reductase YedYZ molybdopterin-dependent catalytic subunit